MKKLKETMKNLKATLKHPPFILIVFLALVIALGAGRLQKEQSRSAGNVEFTELTMANAQQNLGSSQGPVFIFAASSSPESQAQEIVLRAALAEYSEEAIFYKFDVDASPDLASALNVGATPTIILVENSEEGLIPLNGASGLLNIDEVQRFMETGLSASSTASN